MFQTTEKQSHRLVEIVCTRRNCNKEHPRALALLTRIKSSKLVRRTLITSASNVSSQSVLTCHNAVLSILDYAMSESADV